MFSIQDAIWQIETFQIIGNFFLLRYNSCQTISSNKIKIIRNKQTNLNVRFHGKNLYQLFWQIITKTTPIMTSTRPLLLLLKVRPLTTSMNHLLHPRPTKVIRHRKGKMAKMAKKLRKNQLKLKITINTSNNWPRIIRQIPRRPRKRRLRNKIQLRARKPARKGKITPQFPAESFSKP